MALEKCFGGAFFRERWLLEKIKHTHTHNNNFKSRFLFLQETDGSNFKAELLVWSTNIHRSNINDGQARCFRCLVLNDCLAPCTGVWLEAEKKKRELGSTIKMAAALLKLQHFSNYAWTFFFFLSTLTARPATGASRYVWSLVVIVLHLLAELWCLTPELYAKFAGLALGLGWNC